MIHLSMSACRPVDVAPEEFDDFIRVRHLGFAKLLEGLRLLTATKVVDFRGQPGQVSPAWFIDLWWDDAEALTRCFRSVYGLALLGDRMTMMDDYIPFVADASEQVHHVTAPLGRFDPTVGPRVGRANPRLQVLVPPDIGVDGVVAALQSSGQVLALSVGRRTGAAYPLNNVIAGLEQPTVPRTASLGSSIEVWLASADLGALLVQHGDLGALLDDGRTSWWFGETVEVMMSLPVASFMALDPVGAQA